MPNHEHEVRRVLEEYFTAEQVDVLMEIFALRGHSHEIEDIVGLDDELDALEGQ